MKKVIIVMTVLIGIVLGLIGYSGFFSSVTIAEREIGPFTMVLKKHTGSYYKTGVIFDEVEAVLKKGVDTKKMKGVGLYYDDPAKVKEDQLRSECGFIVERSDLEKLGPLPGDYIVRDFNKTLCAVGEFPIRTFLSYMIGPSKAYPRFTEYGKKKKFTGDYSMEIYDNQSKKIIYCMQIENN